LAIAYLYQVGLTRRRDLGIVAARPAPAAPAASAAPAAQLTDLLLSRAGHATGRCLTTDQWMSDILLKTMLTDQSIEPSTGAIMVDFTLTDEQKDLRELAHDFAEKEIRPVAWELDRDGGWPQAIIDKAHEVGLMNTHIPEEYGGAGLGCFDGCLIEEELSWGCSGVQTSLGANGLAAAPVLIGGSEEVKREFCEALVESTQLASFCLTEPDAGSDVSGMRTRAVRRGDKYVLNGSKCFITNGSYADFFVVYAKTDPDAGHRGISAFLVRKDATVIVDKKEDKMGQRASNTATITFNDTEIDARYLLAEENKGFKLAMMVLDRTRPGVAAMATGISRAAFELATAYAKERVQFGVPIAMHQAIQFMLADMATKVHLSRLATWNSAVLLDQGRRNTLESAHAKRFAADSAMEVTTDAVQIFGGYGFIKEYKVEKLMRDAKIMQLYEGTSQIQRLVIARETLLPRRIEEPATATA
jgi:acyl-CoA dehydrogenase